MGRVSTSRLRRAAAGIAWLLAAAGPAQARAQAQDGTAPGASPAGPGAEKRVAISRIEGALRLDGRLDEGPWMEASFRSDFQQKGRDSGYAPQVETSVAFLYDDHALYVGARMEHGASVPARAPVGRRDDPGNADRVLVSLDTSGDSQTAYTFGVSESGVRIDHVSLRDEESWVDRSWDPVWEARVSGDSTGWTAEMRIPFSQIRFLDMGSPVWGVNVRRWHPATFLNAYLVVVPYQETGWVSRFAELHGLSDIVGGAGVHVTPYVLARATYEGSPLAGGPPAESHTRVGGDLKVGLGSSATLDVTVQPDFGQVEADPARVNLTAFETFFPERRPFFTEGREIFQVRGPNWFYSRRIGAVPAGALPPDAFERVESATVKAGAKATGRTPGGLSLGALAAVTGEEWVTVPLDTTGATGLVLGSPRTLFAVGRLRQDVGGGSTVGVVGTAVERVQGPGARLSGLLPHRAFAGGADWGLRFGGRAYEAVGYVGGSVVQGEPAAIGRLQASSTHYFQRPDQPHVRVDADATEMTGWTGGLTLAKVGGGRWLWSAAVDAASPGFEIRDAGNQARADRVDASSSVTYRVRDGSGGMRDRTFGISGSSGWNFGGVRRHASVAGSAAVTWGNLWTTWINGGARLRSLSDDLTRGGPLMTSPLSWWLDLGVGTSQAANATLSVGGGGYVDEVGGWNGSAFAGTRLHVSDRLELEMQTGATVADEARQFVAAVAGGGGATYGTRYVFSHLKRTEAFARARAKVAFLPDVVLTLYAEPFHSSGRFDRFGEQVASSSGLLRAYGTDGTTITRQPDGTWLVRDGVEQFGIGNYNFSVRSFRSTSVFEWEWRQGSMLILIWQRTLSNYDRNLTGAHAPDLFRSLLESLHDPGNNILAVKLSVRMGIP